MSLAELTTLMRSGQYHQALQRARALLPTVDGPADQAYVHYCIYVCLSQVEGGHHLARHHGELCEQLARQAGEWPMLGRLWPNLIATYTDIGDLSRALECGQCKEHAYLPVNIQPHR